MALMQTEQPTTGHAPVKRLLAAALVGMQLQAATVQACNFIKFQAGDGTAIAGRDMQFDKTQEFFPNQFRTRPKGMKFKVNISDPKYAKPGSVASWTVKYPYIAVDLFDRIGFAVDGVNMEGLQCSALYLPGGYAQYQTPPPGAGDRTIPQYTVCDWALGLHKTVVQVNASLPDMYVAGVAVKGQVQPLHYSITDKTGAGIVVEYTKNGTLSIYDNQVGVMTNSPPYDWQLINLGQYAPTMSPLNPVPVMYGNIEFAPTGQWASMVGLPGNSPAPSRFVKMAVFLHSAQNAKFIPDADKAVNLATHLINTGDLVNGTVYSLPVKDKDGNLVPQYEGDTSLWSVVYNLQNNSLWFRSYNNFVWQTVDLNQLDFSEGAPVYALDIYNTVPPPDMTSQFKKA